MNIISQDTGIAQMFYAHIAAPVINGFTIILEIARNTARDDRTFEEMHKTKGLIKNGEPWFSEARQSALQMLYRKYEKGQYIVFADVSSGKDQLIADDKNEILYHIILRDANNSSDWIKLTVSPETTNDDFFALAEKMKFAKDMAGARKIFPDRGAAILANHLRKVIDSERFN